MKPVRTPARLTGWQLLDGAVLHDGVKLASVVLAMNEASIPSLMVVMFGDEDQFEYVGVHQPRLVDLVFQLVALMTGETYHFDCSDMQRTDVDHVWFDVTNLRYYFYDEASIAVGPYRTKEIATERLNWYCEKVLGCEPVKAA